MQVKVFSPSKLNRLRLARGFSQDDLAYELRKRATSASAKQVSRWENGSHAPRSSVIPVLADALGVEIDALYGPAAGQEQSDDDEEAARDMELRRIRSELILAGRDDLAADLLKLTALARKSRKDIA
jgi:transcriptional regulator with XRE-family HTH domain